jgi:hypothetical protein
MVDGFSGRKVIQDATLMAKAIEKIGGTTKLTATELDRSGRAAQEAVAKMRALGIEVPANLHRLATASKAASEGIAGLGRASDVTATKSTALNTTQGALATTVLRYASAAVVGMAITRTLGYAASLEKLAAATGAGIQGAQRLENIAVSTNTRVDGLASGVNELARRLADGDASALGAMQRLGISTEHFIQLRADDQFVAIAAALGRVNDQGTKLSFAKDLFRNWQEVLPALRSDVDKLSNAVKKMSDADVQNIAAVANAWDTAVLAVQRYGAAVLSMAIPKGPSPWLQGMGDWARGQVQGMISPLLGSVPRPAGSASDPIRVGQSAAERRQQDAMATVFGNPEAEALIKKLDDKIAADRQRVQDLVQAMRTQDAEGNQFLWQRVVSLEKWKADRLAMMALPAGILSADTIGAGQTPFDFGAFMRSQIPEIDSRRIGNGMGFGPTPIGSGNAPRTGFFSGAMDPRMLSQNVMGAVMGGGSVGGAVGGTITGSVTERLMSSTIGKSVGKMLGGTLGSIIPGIGTILGSVLGNVVGKLFGKSEESSKVSPSRDRFFEDQGGLSAFNAKLGTDSFAKDIFNAKTVEEYEKAVRSATMALEKYDEQQRASAEAAKLAAKDADALARRQQTIDSGVSKFVDDLARVEDLAKKFKFTKEQRDTALGQSRATATSATALNDFQLLTNAGFTPDDVILKMDKSFDKLAQDAKKLGTTLPNEMKPILERMIEMGTLTDESGKKIEDLAGINFGKTLPESLDTLTQALKDLTAAITGVPSTIDPPKIATPPIELGGKRNPKDYYETPDDLPKEFPNYVAHTGGVLGRKGLKRYHDGGMLKPFEVPFIGEVGEGIVNKRAMGMFGSAWLGRLNRNPDELIAAATRSSGGYGGSVTRNPDELTAAATRSSGGYNAPTRRASNVYDPITNPMGTELPEMPGGWGRPGSRDTGTADEIFGGSRASIGLQRRLPEIQTFMSPPPIPSTIRSGAGAVNVTINLSAIDGPSALRAAPMLANAVSTHIAQGGAAQTKMRGAVGTSRVNRRRR